MKIFSQNKKGQAALEFMLSYGWAILTVMVVVASIAYIVPNQRSLTRNKCTFPPQMPCAGSSFNDDNLTLSLRNSAGVGINGVSARIVSPIDQACTVSKSSLRPDEQFFVYCQNSGAMDIISDTKFIFSVTYIKSQGSYNQTLTGETFAKYFQG